MNTSVGRIGVAACAFVALLLVGTLGGLAWGSFRAASAAEDAGALQAATDLRLGGALLLVVLGFQLTAMTFIAVHAITLVRAPLEALRGGLSRMRVGSRQERIFPEGPAEVQRVAHAVNEMAAALDRQQSNMERTVAMDTIDALIAGFAHEVHTPLTSLMLNDHLLYQQALAWSERQDLPPDVRRQAQKALAIQERNRAGYRRLQNLSRALREVARHGPDGPHRDVNLIVAAALAITHHRMPGGTFVDRELAATRHVECVPSDVFHAVHELLLNAARAVTDRQRIRIWTRDTEDGVEVGIQDDGRGIPHEVLELIQDPASLQDSAANMGLVTVKRIIEGGGGRLDVQTEEGRGTTWRILLPEHAVQGAVQGAQPLPAVTPSPA